MGAVDLEHSGPGHDLFRFRRVHKRPKHVDVPVKDVILRVLVRPVYPLFRKHHGNLRPGDAGHVGMIVDRSADFVLDEVEGLALGPDLLARNRDSARALGRALD